MARKEETASSPEQQPTSSASEFNLNSEARTNGVHVEPLLLRPKEAAAFLAISMRKLWELTNRGEVPSLRVGRSLRYSRPALRAWVDRQQRGRP